MPDVARRRAMQPLLVGSESSGPPLMTEEVKVVIRRKGHAVVGWLVIAAVAVAAVVTFGTGGAGASYKLKAYPRVDTLVTSGTQWGNIAGMNPYIGNNAAGMIGLVNETLLRYDPLAGKYINWLAQSA